PRGGLPSAAVVVRGMSEGAEVDQVLLVREAELRRRRDGAEYLRLSLGDRTGAVAAVVWDGVADCAPHARPGAPARVVGRFAQHPRYGAQITVRTIAPPAPGSFDHDVAVTGALLHDIGKLDAYASSPPAAIDLTGAGRLQGEIPLGYYRVRRLCEEIEGFPPHLAEHVAHIILSHHGSLEHGSPVVPCTREATLVHFLDNLGGRLGSFDRLEKELPDGAAWSPFDRALGGGAYFAARAVPAAEP